MNARVQQLEAQARALLASDRVTAPTRRALAARLEQGPADDAPGGLTPRQRDVLAALAARLVPLGDLSARVPLAPGLEAAVVKGPGDGWRYADMPADAQAMSQGLDALDAASGSAGFPALAPAEQDDLLARVQSGGAGDWPFSSARWFAEVLAGLVRIAYAHPLVQLDIGYDGMADAHGFQDLDAPAR